MNEDILIVTATLILVYGAFSKLAERSVVTPPMLFMGVGVLASPMVFGVLHVAENNAAVELLAEIALIIILCSDASQVGRNEIEKVKQLPIRLLAIGLPLTMLAGTGLALLVFPSGAFPLAALALLAVLLSPTDAALGQAVINSDDVPEDVREALNVESGLNDGISLPAIFALLFALGASLGDIDTDNWALFAAMQLTLGPIAGAAVGIGGGRLIEAASARDWVDPSFQRLSMPAIAMLGYALADAIGGNGFIGAFVAGFTLAVKNPQVREEMQSFGETEGTALSLIVMLLLGLVLIPGTVEYWDGTTTLYSVLSLTVARMVPVAISLLGMRKDILTQLFIGWFGPRGIASILYLLMWVKFLGSSGYETLLATGVQTITLSVVLHGLTAAPLAKRYGQAMKQRRSATEG